MKKKVYILTILNFVLVINTFSQNLENGLIGYWPFNGNANDEILNNHGTVNGATLTVDRLNEISAYGFNGVDDYIDCGNNSSLDLGVGNFSISVWIKTTEIEMSNPIISKLNPSSWIGFQIEQEGSKIEFYLNNTHGNFSNSPIINDGSWHHIITTRIGTNITLYVDGIYIQSLINSAYAENIDVINNMTFGKMGNSNYHFKGSLDEVMIYNRALSEIEIQQLYNNYSLIVTNGLGSGLYEAGIVISITADPAPAGHIFDQWTGETFYIADPTALQTTVLMPTQNISVTANYKVISSPWINYSGNLLFDNGNTNGYKVGIGINDEDFSKDYKFMVNGKIIATEIKVALKTDWSDFVFNNDYELKNLREVEEFIEDNNHLPNIPSAKDVKMNGVNLGEMDSKLLQKIEELTLYTIEQQKQLEKQMKLIEQLSEKLEKYGIE